MDNDVEQILSFFLDDATLVWGPFKFEGKREIEKWAKGLFEIFPKLNLRNKGVNFQGSNVIQNLILEIMLPNSSIARIPCVVNYEFLNGRIRRIVFNLSYGYVTVLKLP
jgi:hypothetical protein